MLAQRFKPSLHLATDGPRVRARINISWPKFRMRKLLGKVFSNGKRNPYCVVPVTQERHLSGHRMRAYSFLSIGAIQWYDRFLIDPTGHRHHRVSP